MTHPSLDPVDPQAAADIAQLSMVAQTDVALLQQRQQRLSAAANKG